jgi:ERCC4-type nuclease
MSKELQPEKLVCIVDSREQMPYDLSPFIMVTKGLPTGDYSILGMEQQVVIERKSMDDFIGSISQGRERFEREIERLKPFESKMILVEASAADIVNHRYRSRMHPNSVMGTMAKFFSLGIGVMLAGNRETAQDFAKRFLYLSAKYRLQPVATSDTPDHT